MITWRVSVYVCTCVVVFVYVTVLCDCVCVFRVSVTRSEFQQARLSSELFQLETWTRSSHDLGRCETCCWVITCERVIRNAEKKAAWMRLQGVTVWWSQCSTTKTTGLPLDENLTVFTILGHFVTLEIVAVYWTADRAFSPSARFTSHFAMIEQSSITQTDRVAFMGKERNSYNFKSGNLNGRSRFWNPGVCGRTVLK